MRIFIAIAVWVGLALNVCCTIEDAQRIKRAMDIMTRADAAITRAEEQTKSNKQLLAKAMALRAHVVSVANNAVQVYNAAMTECHGPQIKDGAM